MRGAVLVLACSITLACRSRHDAPAAPPAADREAGALTNVDVDHGSPADLAEILQRVTGRHIDWDSDALPVVVCAKVTLKREGLDTAALADAVARALRPAGLVLAPAPRGWVVHRAPDAPAPDCIPSGAAPAPPDPATVAAEKAGITRKSATEFEVADRVRRSLAGGDKSLLRRIRLVAQQTDAGVAEVRVFGVTEDSFFGALGIMNGDRLESVSGRRVDSKRAVLDAFRSLATAKSWTFGLRRRDKPLELHYTLAPGGSAPDRQQ